MARSTSRRVFTPEDPSFTDDQRIEPSCDFDYAAVERALARVERGESLEGTTLTPALSHPMVEGVEERDLEAAQEVIRQLINWIWQDGMKNPEGLNIRAIIVCWVFLPHLHPLNLTELARAFGKHKQSLGRWVDDFKRQFPGIRNPHMKK